MKPFNALTLTAYALGAVALAATIPASMAIEKTEGRLTAELTFSSIDAQGKGYIHQGDLERFRDEVFVSMDQDDNGKVSYAEFSDWDPGFSAIAAEAGKQDAYVTAIKIVHAVWDRDGDGVLTVPEMRFAMTTDFRRADLNDDAMLSEEEFLSNFTIIVAMRAAIRPDL